MRCCFSKRFKIIPKSTTSTNLTQISRRNVQKGFHERYGGGYLRTGHRPDKTMHQNDDIPPRVLVTGASGQIGSEIIPVLREKYGVQNVIASDVRIPTAASLYRSDGPFVYVDVTDYDQLARVIIDNQIDWVFHLAAVLSATGEQQPQLAMKINNKGCEHILELAKLNDFRVYIPSSIAAFGPSTPHDNTPNLTIQKPTTVYGISKVYGELLGEYYKKRYNVDFRSLRYPGIISSKTLPGGGTTDYAVEIYHDAIVKQHYRCFLAENQLLPMMYMEDCILATVKIMEADRNSLTECVYNVSGMSFTPKQQAESIKKYIPDFEIEYHPDFRQEIAKTWPYSLDDSIAKNDWKWKPKHDLDSMTRDMLSVLYDEYEKAGLDIRIPKLNFD